MLGSLSLKELILENTQAFLVPFLSRAVFPGILPSRSLRRQISFHLKSWAVILLAQQVVVVGACLDQGLAVAELCTSLLLYGPM